MMIEITHVCGLYDLPDVHVLTALVSDAAIACLSPLEEACVARAVQKRRREFATGRLLARYALDRHFGIRDFELVNSKDRSPVWPRGIAGSLSHTKSRAWVAVVDGARATVGIDGEERPALEKAIWPLVFTGPEIDYLDRLGSRRRDRHALVLFSAKEALYKAQYPRSRQFMGFKALCVHLSKTGRIQYVIQEDIGPFHAGDEFHGRWRDDGFVLTSAWIPMKLI